MNKKITSIAGTVAISAILFTAKFIFDKNAEIAVIQAKLADQEKQVHQLWKYSAWLHQNSTIREQGVSAAGLVSEASLRSRDSVAPYPGVWASIPVG